MILKIIIFNLVNKLVLNIFYLLVIFMGIVSNGFIFIKIHLMMLLFIKLIINY